MPRPYCPRQVGFVPSVTYFKPAGVPLRVLEEVTVTLDELEALRLADLRGLYQEPAAGEMGVSRATFARIVESARRKVAEALISGKALRLEGGPVIQTGPDRPRCGRGGGGGRGGRGRGGGRRGWGHGRQGP